MLWRLLNIRLVKFMYSSIDSLRPRGYSRQPVVRETSRSSAVRNRYEAREGVNTEI